MGKFVPRRRVQIRVQRRVTVRVRQQVTRTAQLRPAPAVPRRTSTSQSRPQLASATRRSLGTGRSAVDQVSENLQEVIGDDPRQYDVFMSHAGPDKDDFVRPLAAALVQGGLSVWYDEFELRVGDSLRRKIDQGIRAARFGIVVLSPAFLRGRPWTEHELDAIVNAYIYKRQVLLPIWHGVSHSDVMDYSPSLADKVALSTEQMSIAEIAEEIVSSIGAQGSE